MAEDIRVMVARASCTWHHNHNGGPTPCHSAEMEADALLGYLSHHGHSIVPDSNVRFDIKGDDIKVWVNDMLVFEGVRKMLAWDDPDAKPGEVVRDFMDEMWRDAQDQTVQEYVINGVPAHMTVNMSLRDLMTPGSPFKRFLSVGANPETAVEWPTTWDLDEMESVDVGDAVLRGEDSRLFDLLQRSVMPWSGEPITKPARLTAETIREAIDRAQVYMPPMVLPDYYRVHITPPNPRVWAEQHVTAHPDHIVMLAAEVRCFYPEDCKATMWTDPDYSNYQRNGWRLGSDQA